MPVKPHLAKMLPHPLVPVSGPGSFCAGFMPPALRPLPGQCGRGLWLRKCAGNRVAPVPAVGGPQGPCQRSRVEQPSLLPLPSLGQVLL